MHISLAAEPLFHFGYGLSYTTFIYENLKVSKSEFAKDEPVEVEFTIKNSGDMKGAETVQLYVRDVKCSVMRPDKELKGFKKIFLEPGEIKTVKMILNKYDFSFWDEKINDWNAEPGEFEIIIGSSSNDIRLKTQLNILPPI